MPQPSPALPHCWVVHSTPLREILSFYGIAVYSARYNTATNLSPAERKEHKGNTNQLIMESTHK